MTSKNSYSLREYNRTDATHVVAMLNANRTTPRAVVDGAGNIRLIRYVPFSSSKTVVEDAQGQIVGYAYVADKENSFVFETGGGVHPEYENAGVGSMLVAWAEAESRRLSEQAPAGVRGVLQVNLFESEGASIQLFEAEGFEKVRTWAHYEIQLNSAPPAPNLPERMSIRRFDLDNDDDWDLVSPVQDAAFMDHWGAYTLPPAERVETEDPDDNREEEPVLDFSYSNAQGYCFIAFVGEEAAGGILCNARLVEFSNTGRVGSVFTHPKFRRQGVGRNLMLAAFNTFYQCGMRRVILDTDSQSFTDSAKFYTNHGMSIYRREFLYEKEICAGREIRKFDREG
ncbi:MAG TPA: GNAT family N-acetyltransferase [Anaerolineales bacterium]|nr:GNAT family N-acetyltransferase [Anaerolineales bacterium]